MANLKALVILATALSIQSAEPTKVGILTANLKKACSLAQSLRQAGQKANHDTAARLSDVETLSDLAEDLAAIVRRSPLSTNSKSKLVAELARQSAQEALNIVNSNLNKIFDLTATAANIAGNIQEAAQLLFNTGSGVTSECVSDAAAFSGVTVSTTAIPGCLKIGGDFEDADWQPNLRPADIQAAVTALPDGETGITSGGTACKLMHYNAGRSTTGTAGTTMMAGLIKLGAAAANEPTFNDGRTQQLVTANSRIGKVHAEATSLAATIGKNTATAGKLLQLGAEEEPADLTIEIAQGSLGDNYPANAITITKEETKAIHKMIKKHREGKETDQLKKARDIFFRNDLEVNKTACNLGAKQSPKQDCEVTKTEPQKCEGKVQEDCRDTAGCEWKDSTCKLTEKAKKEAEKAAKQEAGGNDGKTDCSSHQDQKSFEAVSTACKQPTCGWISGKEGEDKKEKG